MKIKKSRLLSIIQEEISRLDEEDKFSDLSLDALAMAAKEDADAMGPLLGRLLEKHRKFALAKAGGNEADAEDALQNAAVKVFKKLDSFRGEAAFSTWAGAIIDNSIIDSFRKKKKETPRAGVSSGRPGEASIGDISDASQDETVFYPIRQKTLDPLQAIIQKQNFEKYGDSVSDLLPDKDKKTFEQLMKFIEEKGLDTTGSATGGKKYSKSIVNQEQFGRFISPDGENLPYSTAQSAGRRALDSLEAALARGGKKLKQQGNLEETIKNTILEMYDDSSDLPPGLVPADDDLRDSIRADVDEMHPGLKDWNQDVYEGLVDFITSNYEAEDADLRKDGYLPPKGPEFDYVGYEDPGSLGKLGDLKEAIKEALKDLI